MSNISNKDINENDNIIHEDNIDDLKKNLAEFDKNADLDKIDYDNTTEADNIPLKNSEPDEQKRVNEIINQADIIDLEDVEIIEAVSKDLISGKRKEFDLYMRVGHVEGKYYQKQAVNPFDGQKQWVRGKNDQIKLDENDQPIPFMVAAPVPKLEHYKVQKPLKTEELDTDRYGISPNQIKDMDEEDYSKMNEAIAAYLSRVITKPKLTKEEWLKVEAAKFRELWQKTILLSNTTDDAMLAVFFIDS